MINVQQSSNDNENHNEIANYSSSTHLSPAEEALQSLCKQLLKSRLFRGYYIERRFVNSLNDYRDLVSLQRSEKELEKLLLDIRRRLELFYIHSATPDIWIGITHGPLINIALEAGALETFLWVELDELAFGQYWFIIKSIRFRQKEIILKIKLVREVEDESKFITPFRTRKNLSTASTTSLEATKTTTTEILTNAITLKESKTTITNETNYVEEQINLQDFIEIVRNWGIAIKHNVYEFMAQDINKENIKSLLRFIGLLIFSLLSGAVVGIKFLGMFTLRFMFEFSRLTHVLTPIILKIIDVFNKIIGGFYILIAMIWRDTLGKRGAQAPEQRMNFREVDYNRPMYRAIQYDVRQSNQSKLD